MIGEFISSLRIYSKKNKIIRRFPKTKIEKGFVIKGDISNIELGDNVQIQSNCTFHLGGMEWCERLGKLKIGAGSVVSPNCVFYGCGPGGIVIGENLDCGPGVCIFSSQTDYRRGKDFHIFAPVVIGKNVIIYSSAVICPGVSIGDNAVIAAGAVVIRDVPADTLVGGIPSKTIKKKMFKIDQS